MARMYNSHFSRSNNWRFDSEMFGQLCRSYNVNLRAMYDLPHGTHCWIVEQLSGGRHAKQQIFSRFVKFVDSLKNNKRRMIRDLFSLLKADARSTVGSNLRTILIDTDVQVIPGITTKWALSDFTVYEVKGDWQVPLLTSLLEIRDDNWEVKFDDESRKNGGLDNDIVDMITDICVN